MTTDPLAIDPIGLSSDDKILNVAVRKAKTAFEAASSVSKKNQSQIAGFYEEGHTYKAGAASWMSVSEKFLADPTTPASLLLLSAANVLGPLMTSWDPDTLWS